VRFSKSHALAGPISFDELDAARFKRLSEHYKGRVARLRAFTLKHTNGGYPDAGGIGELLLSPVKQAPGRPTLGRCNQRSRRSHRLRNTKVSDSRQSDCFSIDTFIHCFYIDLAILIGQGCKR
jgi:hypothetical protein